MRGFAGLAKVLIWALLIWMLFFQIIAIVSIRHNDAAMGINSSYETDWLWICTIGMTLAVLLFMFLPRGKFIPMLFAFAFGIGFVFIAVSIHEYFGAPAGVTDAAGTYLTAWKATYRHASPLLIPLLMVPVWLVHREDVKLRQRAEDEAPVESVLGGFTIKSLDE